MIDHNHLLKKHKELDYLCRHPGNRIFISDWYCNHPYTKRYLPPETFTDVTKQDLLYYCFQNDSDTIHKEIIKFHQKCDGVVYKKEEIYVGAGMTGLITAQIIMMKTKGVDEIYYTKPMYYTFYYLAKLFHIKIIPVCDVPLNKERITLHLPKKKSCLVICDPLWYMGRSIVPKYIERIRQWQHQTGSFIIVDGAFQYMKWDLHDRFEPTSQLDRELTFRSICPTKALVIHGIRFSYTILPRRFQEYMRYAYANSFGASCVYSHKAAKRIMEILNSPESNGAVLDYIKERYYYYLKCGIFTDRIGANATYFIFVKILRDISRYIVMDQDFFDTTNYPGFVRFNLLLPHKIHL